ncbi:hypothetical protein CDD83_3813 [Cordyceps sp. RAO-2017]|nr:hypothetical protein CDD83_3813 [Cordyceps sp. RAO-2017]
MGHVVGDEYVFEGRKTDDFIERVPRLAVEEAISSLPYVSEAHVLRVPDHETRSVCGALVRIKENSIPAGDMSIRRLHADLDDTLPAYMRPYLLRILKDGEEVPCTASQKPIRSEMLRRFFGVMDFWNSDTASPEVEVWHERFAPADRIEGANPRPWDWATWQTSV